MTTLEQVKGRAHSNGRRPRKLLVTPVFGVNAARGRQLVRIKDILYFFTTAAAVGADRRIFATWATPHVIRQSGRIYVRTPALVGTIEFASIDQVVRDLPRLALAVAANGVAVNLDQVDDIDDGGRYGRLGFRIADTRGQLTETEWLLMSRKRGPEVLHTFE